MPAGGRRYFLLNAFGNSLRISRLEVRPTEPVKESPPAAKKPVPSQDEQSKVIDTVNEIYAVAKANNAVAKSALAGKLLAAGLAIGPIKWNSSCF